MPNAQARGGKGEREKGKGKREKGKGRNIFFSLRLILNDSISLSAFFLYPFPLLKMPNAQCPYK
jgi:hypothetical protein